MLAALLPAKLRQILARLPKIALAYSGGIDSRFLAHAARLCGCQVLAINASGPHISPSETAWARAWAKKQGFRLMPLEFNPLGLAEIRTNSRLRCYACKKALLEQIRAAIASLEPQLQICDGSNLDDLQLFRPGQRAVTEADVISPLAEAGITKAEIRALAAATGLEFSAQPSRPCLLTRLAYGLPPTPLLLARIAACEAAITAQFGADLEFRLRLLPAPLLQIAGEPPAGLARILADLGFANAEIRQCESVSGYFDQTLY